MDWCRGLVIDMFSGLEENPFYRLPYQHGSSQSVSDEFLSNYVLIFMRFCKTDFFCHLLFLR